MTYMILQAEGAQTLSTAVANQLALTPTLTPLGGPVQLGPTWTQALVTASSGSGSSYTLPAATATTLGGVIVGDNLTVDSTGKISGAAAYTLSAATSSALGGVKLAANVANAGQSTATDVTTLVTDFNTLATKFNALLAAMQAAGQQSAAS